jgi:uncharacterized protein
MMEIPVFIYSFIVVLVAGFVRGYSGFGASMIIVVSLSLVLPVTEIVPVILLLEVLASSFLLPKVIDEVDWRSLYILLIGVTIGTPAGVYLLSNMSDRLMRATVSILIILLIPLMWKGFALAKMPGRLMTVLTGVFSGLINGSAAIGGPPVVLFYFSSPKGVNISRASLIAFFLVTDIFASGICALNGLVNEKTFYMTGIFIVPLIIGLALGSRSFLKTDPELFRKRVLLLLLFMTVTTVSRSILP